MLEIAVVREACILLRILAALICILFTAHVHMLDRHIVVKNDAQYSRSDLSIALCIDFDSSIIN